jgi:molybdopterin/thiamine biosynthesis adenylyltransferase
MTKLIFTDTAAATLAKHLASSAPSEEGAFCLIRTARSADGWRLLVTDVILPPKGAWELQAVDQLRPSARWLSAAIGRAIEAHAGLLFIHSHPLDHYPVGFSLADEIAFRALARDIAPMLDGPFAAAVAHPRGWTGVVARDGGFEPVGGIAAVGRTLRLLHPTPARPEDAEIDSRQLDALGVVHRRLRQLTVAVVGCGGTGSPVAEQLVRMGVGVVILVDHDPLDTLSNVRRLFGSKMKDFDRENPRPKVDVVGDHLDGIGLPVRVCRVRGDVRTERVFRALLDADVVINATDTHGSRAIVNELASSYLLPVIDVGVRVGSKANGNLTGLAAEVRVLTPKTPCLWCRGAINADVIREENLPPHERRQRAREGYTVGRVGESVPSVVALTVLGSGLATSALLTLLSDEGECAPSGYVVDGFLGDSFMTKPTEPILGCRCQRRIGLGDEAAPPFMPEAEWDGGETVIGGVRL